VDQTTERLVDYALGYPDGSLTAAARASTINHLFDAVGVAIAGTTAEPARIATRRAVANRADPGCTVIGHGRGVAPDMAAFANAVMVRTYDWNDGMQAKAGGHPSDMVPALLAVAELTHATGAELVNATALAYELLGGLGAATDRQHFDQGLFMGAAAGLACGRLLGLDRQRLAHVASLGLTTAIQLGVHRWGELSMTKGASTAFAVRNAVFCALLAHDGFTSAPEPVEGYFGLWALLGEFEPRLPVMPGGPTVVEMSHQKPIPAESQVLGILDRVSEIRRWSPVEDIESIDITMSAVAARHVADPPKYRPRNRETADHSLPYMLAVALVDGAVALDSYAPERFADPGLLSVMDRITVRTTPEFDAIRDVVDGVTRAHPIRAVFRTKAGDSRTVEVRYHKGHYRDPMTRADLDAKFDLTCAGVVGPEQRERIRAAWWAIDAAPDVTGPMALLAGFGDAGELGDSGDFEGEGA
jgi:2-methylcitrate dehydratase